MKINYKILVALLIIVFAGSCSDFLEVQPKDKQTDKQLFSAKGGFYTASNGIYNKLASNSLYGKSLTYEMIDVLSKRYVVSPANTYLTALNNWDYADESVQRAVNNVWSTAYKAILNANILMENIENQEGILTEREASILKGEMLALRAFLHFDMLRMFGPFILEQEDTQISIPYNESSTIQVLEFLPVNEVKGKILRDLEEAERLLREYDPIINDGPLAYQPEDMDDVQLYYRQMRFNYYSVLALKARVCLYTKDNENALQTAKAVIEDTKVQEYFPSVDPNKLLANELTPDRLFSTESFMGIYVRTMRNIFTYNFNPENANLTLLQPRANFVSAQLFANETSDYRYQSQWQQSSTVGFSGEILIKYKGITDDENKFFYGTYMPLIRLSEMYLIAAECEPNFTDGNNWLNQHRIRRGLNETTVANATALTNSLKFEYLREFYGEGQIFYMYKRLRLNILNTENGYNQSSYPVTAARFVVPMPAREVENR